MGGGQWETDCGQWAVEGGQWPVTVPSPGRSHQPQHSISYRRFGSHRDHHSVDPDSRVYSFGYHVGGAHAARACRSLLAAPSGCSVAMEVAGRTLGWVHSMRPLRFV